MVSVGRGRGRRGAAHIEPTRSGKKKKKKEGNFETCGEFASNCHWEGATVTRKKQKTTKQQTKKSSKLDSQPY
jgi:hypothetical protein